MARLIAEDASTKQVAAKLSVSGKTIETHRANVFAKLKVHTVAELVHYALQIGLIQLRKRLFLRSPVSIRQFAGCKMRCSKIKSATVAIAKVHNIDKSIFEVIGSGVCIHPKGLILTCQRVISAFMETSTPEQLKRVERSVEPQLRLLESPKGYRVK